MKTNEYIQKLIKNQAPLAAAGTEQYDTESEILVAVSRLEYILEHGRDPKHDTSYLSVEGATEGLGR
jgi:hypothetical protein